MVNTLTNSLSKICNPANILAGILMILELVQGNKKAKIKDTIDYIEYRSEILQRFRENSANLEYQQVIINQIDSATRVLKDYQK